MCHLHQKKSHVCQGLLPCQAQCVCVILNHTLSEMQNLRMPKLQGSLRLLWTLSTFCLELQLRVRVSQTIGILGTACIFHQMWWFLLCQYVSDKHRVPAVC